MKIVIRCLVDGSLLRYERRRLLMDNGRWTIDNGQKHLSQLHSKDLKSQLQWSMVNGQWSK